MCRKLEIGVLCIIRQRCQETSTSPNLPFFMGLMCLSVKIHIDKYGGRGCVIGLDRSRNHLTISGMNPEHGLSPMLNPSLCLDTDDPFRPSN